MTSPGARSIGVVGPSSVPFERWTSILTLVRVLLVVFSTVPTKALLAESKFMTSRAPPRTASKVWSGARVAALASSPPDAPDSLPSLPSLPSPPEPSPPEPCSPPEPSLAWARSPFSGPSDPRSPVQPVSIKARSMTPSAIQDRNLFVTDFMRIIASPPM